MLVYMSIYTGRVKTCIVVEKHSTIMLKANMSEAVPLRAGLSVHLVQIIVPSRSKWLDRVLEWLSQECWWVW